jgi:transposase
MAQQGPQRRGSTAPCRRTDDPSRAAPDIGDTRLADMHIVSSGGSTLRKHSATLSDWAEPCNSEDPPQRDAGRPSRDHRQVVEGIVHRYRTGITWRDLPREFGSWQKVWKRHHRFSRDGTWDRLLPRLQACGRRRRGVRLAGLGRLHRGAGASARRDGQEVTVEADVAHRPPTGLVTSADEAPVHQGPKTQRPARCPSVDQLLTRPAGGSTTGTAKRCRRPMPIMQSRH